MNNETINEVRIGNDIVEVISSYLPLVKKGKNFFGVCPFHDDNNPSMSVSSEKQIYKCFSCGASGNVFNFVMDYEHLDFKEALEILAKKAGISLKNVSVKTNNKYDKYFKMYDLATKLYQNNLNTKEGLKAKEYLTDRGITEEAIKEFKIGLSLSDKSTLTKILNGKEYTNKELEIYGLGNGNNDLFINRIMFPINDISGKTVGFSGRIYLSKSDSKYINTKETPIFKKGEILYNYHGAKERIRLDKKLIITEGFLDVIRLFSNDIKNAVAIMGTSLTKEQVSLIKRLSNNIYLSLDGDSAGKKAALTIGDMLDKKNLNVFVITLPNELDPDEYIKEKGIKSYLSLIDAATPYSEYKINYLKEGKDLTNIDDQTKYINEVLDEIKTIEDDIKIELMLKKLALEFNLDIEILRNKLQKDKKYSKIVTVKKQEETKEKKDKYQKATYRILYYILNSNEAAKLYERKLNFLPYPNARFLANEITYYYKINGKLVLADFITTLNNKTELKELLNNILQELDEEEFDLKVFEEYISVIKGYSKTEEIKRLKKLIEEEPDPDKKIEILEKIRIVKMGS